MPCFVSCLQKNPLFSRNSSFAMLSKDQYLQLLHSAVSRSSAKARARACFGVASDTRSQYFLLHVSETHGPGLWPLFFLLGQHTAYSRRARIKQIHNNITTQSFPFPVGLVVTVTTPCVSFLQPTGVPSDTAIIVSSRQYHRPPTPLPSSVEIIDTVGAHTKTPGVHHDRTRRDAEGRKKLFEFFDH